MKRADLQEHLQGRLADSRVPTLNELSTTLKEDFKIRYIKENPANVRYRDPEIDDRRAWASRILSHMLSEDFLVISVDETHIRSDKNNHYAWQFVANERPFMKVLKQGFENEIIQDVEEDKESEVGDISSEVSELSARTFKLGEKRADMPKRPRGRPKKEGPALPPRPKRPVGRPRSARSQSQQSLPQHQQDQGSVSEVYNRTQAKYRTPGRNQLLQSISYHKMAKRQTK
ncbi:hypothetical protein FGO68_gene13118 [Halteria grandinella]|uniref:Uncharacterized protein n=1 Tax=Halteria grandinella TaxID=5974 RepID=A0A8J8STW8_HALGN|nr:hypothetical protein FGO68_gene13118 [Halteria grandinella]